MKTRSHLTPAHRAARSALVKLLDDALLLKGALVTMARTCGKPNCRCAGGDKHVSLYLAVRVGEKRKMIYVPPELEDTVGRRVRTGRQAEQLLAEISQACLDRFLAAKQALREQKRAGRRRVRP